MSARLPAAVLALLAVPLGTPALAGALDRTGQPIDPLFEPGGYAELSFGRAFPDVSGTQVAPIGPLPPGASSGDLAENFSTFAFAIKRDFTERFSGALIYDRPLGADVDYPAFDPLAPFFNAGASAEVDSNALTALLRYRLRGGFSVHGGLRYQTIEGQASIPFVGGAAGQPYAIDSDRDEGLGYVAGVAYERPDIALRIALTYASEIDHDLRTEEVGLVPGDSTTEITTPESVRLDFQTGIAPDTLLFGAIRWADWSEFEIRPQGYLAITGGPLLFYPEDITTYTLGLGRRFTERFSAAISVSYEEEYDEFVTNLGPTAGVTSIGLGATYAFDQVELTGAVQYGWLGDARTAIGGQQVTQFEDNEVVALGLQVAYRF